MEASYFFNLSKQETNRIILQNVMKQRKWTLNKRTDRAEETPPPHNRAIMDSALDKHQASRF